MKIISGGQTGVDRGALDAAIALGIPHGGWCPRGRLAEDGRIPDQYQLQETDSTEYSIRTEQNVCQSDATLILCFGAPTGGTDLTRRFAKQHGRPCLVVEPLGVKNVAIVKRWLTELHPEILNVAGPRESQSPGISDLARDFLLCVLDRLA